ncbi:peptide chain release factor-like protein [Paraliomyxa miuraensis]|uniref:peptide chain release factor-like protein n=1 Tax=Paraliomyxa miuraensis TaxID=376150 RepID=UPI002256E822|nr:peptide chain release factor-like protein [Paraliomyxa miuraensis]MCX4241526.1 hypothetical protein [Paraliomyxa miuraensis]
MSTLHTLRIGAGRGPREARRFVVMLTQALCERLQASGAQVEAIEAHGDPSAPGRVLVRVRGDGSGLNGWVGTHQLTADLRGPHARRRWFAAIEHDRPEGSAPIVLARSDLEIRFVRSRGPGGQNVNKRSTAVQITHRPTGIAVQHDAHRSQSRNRAAALQALQRAVTRHLHEAQASTRALEAWQARRDLPTHRPVMQWQLDPHRPDTIVPQTQKASNAT